MVNILIALQLYNMRKKHLKRSNYRKNTWEFMSEESCVEDDDNMINKHPVPFRSESSHYSFIDVCLSCMSCIYPYSFK